jgi:hypothetical protein
LKNIVKGNILPVFGDPNFLIFQVEVCVESVKEGVAQEDDILRGISHRFDIGLTVAVIGLGFSMASLEVVLLLQVVGLIADGQSDERKFIEVADSADEEGKHWHIVFDCKRTLVANGVELVEDCLFEHPRN